MVPILLVAALALAQATEPRQYPSGTERRVFEVRSRDATKGDVRLRAEFR